MNAEDFRSDPGLRMDDNGRITHFLVAIWEDGASLWRRLRRPSDGRHPSRESVWFTYYGPPSNLAYQQHLRTNSVIWTRPVNRLDCSALYGHRGIDRSLPARVSWVLPRIGIVSPAADFVLSDDGGEAGTLLIPEKTLELDRLLGNEEIYLLDDETLASRIFHALHGDG